MQKLMLLLIIILVSINVNAINVNYNFFEGTISSDGDLLKTQKQINNVNILGFTCLDINCKRLGNKIFDLNSGNNSSITLNYPEILQSNYGYGIYYYKDGFISWESNPSWFGLNSETRGPFEVYLTKKETCTSFITNFSVVNSEKTFMPLKISAIAQLNASTLSAIRNSGPLEAIPNEISQHYKLRQLMRLTVLDENNTVLSDQTQREFINFSSSKTFNFEYTPVKPGKYSLKLQSRVIDPKCITSQDVFSSKLVSIYDQEPVNMCYTLLNNVNLNSYNVKAGDTIVISGKKVSNRLR